MLAETWVAVGAAAVAGAAVGFLRTRVPAPASVVVLAASSAALAWGLIHHRPDPSAVEIVLAVSAMAVLGPVHVRALLGPFGPR